MKQSAGILLYRKISGEPEFLLVHPGGPFWKNKDHGSWSIPKGEFTGKENAFDAAIREFEEETGVKLAGDFNELTPGKLKSGKIIYAWAIEGDLNAELITSNTFEIEWPPKSGKMQHFPEVDKGEWLTADKALEKINPAQGHFIVELVSKLQ